MASDRPPATGEGYGKLILFGEHAVVYGAPAVVGSLDEGARATAEWLPDGGSEEWWAPEGGSEIRLEVGEAETPSPEDFATLERAFYSMLEVFGERLEGPVSVEIEVGIPVGVGLGSSAALCAATARAIASLVGIDSGRRELVEEVVDAGEAVFHGNPSGIDRTASLDGGLIFYRPGDPTERATIEIEGCRFGVCVAGPPASTAEMVDGVRGLREREPELFEYVKLLIGDTARFGSGAMRQGNWERVGELMDVNHGALTTLGVSTEELDRACHVARDAGALGAKLTGAGGGGCVVALLPEEGDEVLERWEAEGWTCFEVGF